MLRGESNGGPDFQKRGSGAIRHFLRGAVPLEANGSDSGSLVHPEIHNTGQETFFRRDQICPRLELILSRRDGTSLEKLAGELEGERQQRRSARRLVVEDRFGQREFTVEEIQSARLTDGERESDILEFLKEAPL